LRLALLPNQPALGHATSSLLRSAKGPHAVTIVLLLERGEVTEVRRHRLTFQGFSCDDLCRRLEAAGLCGVERGRKLVRRDGAPSVIGRSMPYKRRRRRNNGT
jgi:hypothetical protein